MPTVLSVGVDVASWVAAKPRSISFTWPELLSMMLPGLMSRCTTPSEARYCSTSATSSTMRSAVGSSNSCPASRCSSSVLPSTYSMRAKNVLPLRATPKPLTRAGWFSLASSLASAMKALRVAVVRVETGFRTFSAIVRPVFSSRARNTSAVPPWPALPTIS